MFCPQCGSKLAEGARFCPQCGARVGADAGTGPEPTGGEKDVAASPGPAGGDAGRRSLASRLIEFRRTTLRAVPTFVIGIVAALLLAGTAYALYRVAVDVVIPMVQEWTEPQGQGEAQPEEPPAEEEPDEQELLNEQAHAAYEEVLDEYRTLHERDDYMPGDAVGVNDSSYWTDDPWRAGSNYPYVSDYVTDEATSGWGVRECIEHLEFAYLDLNGDGVDELVIISPDDSASSSDGPVICAVYVFADGEVKGIVQSFYRDVFWLMGGGVILERGSSGWNYWIQNWYQLSDDDLSCIESVSSSAEGADYPIELVHMIGDEEVDRVVAQSEEEYSAAVEAMLGEAGSKYSPSTGISWTSLV